VFLRSAYQDQFDCSCYFAWATKMQSTF